MAARQAGRVRFDVEADVPVRRGRLERRVLVGDLGATRAAPIHLDPAPHDDALERTRAHRGTQRVHGALLRAQRRGPRRHPCRRLVHAEVGDGGGREVEHEIHEAVAVARVDALEHGPLESSAWRHEVEPGHGLHLRAGLEELRDTACPGGRPFP